MSRSDELPRYDSQLSALHRAFEPELRQVTGELPLEPASADREATLGRDLDGSAGASVARLMRTDRHPPRVEGDAGQEERSCHRHHAR